MRSFELRTSRALQTLATVFAALALAGGVTGCGSIAPVEPAHPPVTDPTQLYSALTLNQLALNLSTDVSDPGYYTFHLVATPRDALGNPMAGLPAPTFLSLDTTRIKVTADGMITALGAGTDLKVIVTLVSGPVTHLDTVFINVTSSVTQLASLSIHPLPPDSALWPVMPEGTGGASASLFLLFAGYVHSFFGPTLAARALDPAATDFASQLQLEYFSLDPLIAKVGRRDGQVTVIQPGQVRMVVRTNAYGVLKADTATFTVTLPLGQDVVVQAAPSKTGTGPLVFFPSEVKIRPGGIIIWSTTQGDSVDVTFEDPSQATVGLSGVCDVINLFLSFGNYFVTETPVCGTGNFVLAGLPAQDADGLPVTSITVRQFLQAGTYAYHSTRTGATGQIVVSDAP